MKLMCFLSLALFWAVGANADSKIRSYEAKVAKTPVEALAKKVAVTGLDKLDPVVRVSTYSVMPEFYAHDSFVRAACDKATKTIYYQVYLSTVTKGGLRPNKLVYEAPEGTGSAKVETIDIDVSCAYSSCQTSEDSVAEIPRDVLDWVAKSAPPDDDSFWRFKLFGASTEGVDYKLSRAEIAALLLVADREFGRLTNK